MSENIRKRMCDLDMKEYEANADREQSVFDMIHALKIIYTAEGIAEATGLTYANISKYMARTKAIISADHVKKIQTVYLRYKDLIDSFADCTYISKVDLPFTLNRTLNQFTKQTKRKRNAVISQALTQFLKSENKTTLTNSKWL